MEKRRMRFLSPFGGLYDEAGMSPLIRRSIMFVIFANICGNLWGTITSGTALTGYAQALGANDFVFGVLTGIPLAATLIQIPAAALVSRTQKRKKYLLTFGLVSRALWLVIGLVPYFVPMNPAGLRLWSVIFLIGISSASGSFINVCFTPWLADLVPIGIRGRWISLRDGINAVTSVAIGLLTAYMLDTIPGNMGYAIVFTIGGVLGVGDMLCFAPVQEVYSQPPVKTGMFKIIGQVVRDKPFFSFMMFWTAWCFTANISGPFLNRYALGDMGLTYMQVTLFGQIASALTTVVVISSWGRLLDRFGSKPVLWISCVIASLTPIFYCFSVPGSIWPTLLHNVVGAAFWSAANLTATSMQLSCSPDNQRPSYIAIFSCATSLLGSFLGVLLGGALLEWIQASMAGVRFAFLGQTIDHYKIVFFLSVVARFGIVLAFIPHMRNEKGYTVHSMVRTIVHEYKRG